MAGYFEMNNRGSPSSHWLPANSASLQDEDPASFSSLSFHLNPNPDDTLIDSLEPDPNYTKEMSEFETSLQERMKEEQKEEEMGYLQTWTNSGLQITALITEHVLSHPFIVLRRQCQVNNKLSCYHLFPVTIVPVIVNLHRWQGLTCLWKGVGSVLVIKGLTLAVQDLLSKITSWPKEVTLDSKGKYIGKHIMLKCVTSAIITPFYAASLLETVQSEIASEKPEFLDVFKEGLRRLLSFGAPQKGRMLPVWSLIVPTAMYFIAKHFFTLCMKTVISRMLTLNHDFQHRKQGAIPKDFDSRDGRNIELTSSLVAVLSADVVLYPLETILHRLHLQGTRTIIDNLDNGLSVTPILTNFEGVVDCYEATVQDEGVCGLYKGFGTLVLQCLTYTCIIKLSKLVLTQVSLLFCKNDSISYRVDAPIQQPPLPQQPDGRIRNPIKTKKRNPINYDYDDLEDYQKF